jgi:predicted PurR-regulated permease PerM
LAAIVLVGLLLVLLAWAAPVMAPILLGIAAAALTSPMSRSLRQHGASAGLAVAATSGLVIVVGIGLVVLGLTSVAVLRADLAGYADDLEARYPELSDALANLGLGEAIAEIVTPETLTAVLVGTISILVDLIGAILIATVLAALLLLDADRLGRLLGDDPGEHRTLRSLPRALAAAVTYFTVRIRVNAVTAAGLLALMVILGVDHALLWAVGTFFLSFIPYIGLVVAMIPPTILAFAEGGLAPAIVIVIGGTILNLAAENVLEPVLTGRALHLSTWVVFVSFFIWVWILGPVGALLSMPITVLVVLVLEQHDATLWLARAFGRSDSAGSGSQTDP